MPADDACRCCGQPGTFRIVDTIAATDTPERFKLVQCAACNVIRTSPEPADLAPYYATDLAATMTEPGSRVFAALRRWRLGRELRRITRSGDPGTLIDVGCGSGDFARVIRRRGFPVIAADQAPGPPRPLAGHAAIPYVRFDFETYELHGLASRGPFTVILRHVLEHVRDPRACLERLQQQGARRFYVAVPNAGGRERRLLGSAWYLWDPPRHLWHFDRQSLARVCERAGLAIMREGVDTASTLLPSLYRYLRVHGWPPALYERFGPTSLLTAVAAPLNLVLCGNVLWVVAQARSQPREIDPP